MDDYCEKLGELQRFIKELERCLPLKQFSKSSALCVKIAGVATSLAFWCWRHE